MFPVADQMLYSARTKQYPIRPTGNAATDTQALKNACTAIENSQVSGQIVVIDNAIPLTLRTTVPGFANGITTTGNVFIRGQTKNAEWNEDPGFHFEWGASTDIFNSTASYTYKGTCGAVTAGAGSIATIGGGLIPGIGTIPGDSGNTPAGANLFVGDYVVIYSNIDAITNADPHLQNGRNHPAELHRVARISGTTIFLDEPIIDTMANPLILKIILLPNCGFADLRVTCTGSVGAGVQSRAWKAFRTRGFRWENITAERMPGYPFFDVAADLRFQGHTAWGQPNDSADYGVAVGIANGYRVSDCTFYNPRHAFTTGGFTISKGSGTNRGSYGSGTTYALNEVVVSGGLTYRSLQNSNTNHTPASSPTFWEWAERVWGTPAHGVIHNCHMWLAGDGNSSWTGFDTHSGGYNTLFENCSVRSSLTGFTIVAFNARARKTRFHRCKAIGEYSPYPWMIGFEIRGGDSEIRECEIENADEGIRITEGIFGGLFPNHIIDENRFTNIFGNAIRVQKNGIDNVLISRNKGTKVNWGYADNSTGVIRNTWITMNPGSINVPGSTGHRIRENYLDKDPAANSESISTNFLTPAEIELSGNHMRGYGFGSGAMGYFSATAQATDIYNAYETRNFHD